MCSLVAELLSMKSFSRCKLPLKQLESSNAKAESKMCGLSERYLHHLAQKVKRRTASGSAFGSTAEGPASCQAPSQTCHEYSACSRPGCSLTCVFGLSWIQLNEEAKPSNTADFRSGAVSSTKSVCRKSQPARGCTLWYNFQLEI